MQTVAAEISHVKKLRAYEISQPKWQRIILLSVLGYEAAGGIAGGILLTLGPDGRYMEMPVDIMRGFFTDYKIPGLILFAMGMLTLFSFYSVLRRTNSDWLMATIALAGWVIWFTVEIAILQAVHWLHFMWGYPVFLGIVAAIPLIALRNNSSALRKGLLTCGILSTLWYIAINIYVPMQDKGHSVITQVVSELSAVGAPTRILWILLVTLYPILYVAFGWGVLQSAAGNRSLRVIGTLIILYSVITFYWPPMQMRGNEMALTDVLHIALGITTLVFNLAILGFGIAAFRGGFRTYSIFTLIVFIVTGILIGTESVNLAANLPTPLIGVWERINIALYMTWIAILGWMIMRKNTVSESVKSIH